MSRLTKKIDNHYIIECPNLFNYIDGRNQLKELLSTQDKGIQKLGELEDIEKELGIDLITLFKAGGQRYIFVKNAFGEINSREIHDIDIYAKIIVYYLEYQPERQLMHQHLNMYGKTWALTLKELENE